MISLKRLLAKKDVQFLVQQITNAISSPITIQDTAGNILWSDRDTADAHTADITVAGIVLGQVQGENGSAIATLLSHLVTKETEKKALAQETLDRYKEITLLYDLSEKITTNLELQAVSELVLNEAQKLVQCDRGMILLLNPETETFEPITMFAQSAPRPLAGNSKRSLGVLQAVLDSGRGEIVNDVEADARSSEWEKDLRSLIAAPLKREERVIGLITLSNSTSGQYTAADLKRLSTLASQAATAIENALLHAYKLREERIKSNLERYVPSQVVQAILQSQGEISLAPTRQDIAILFSDIRNFTSQCEALPPETIVGHLNEYFTHMVEEIFEHRGTVNKFVGDMIVALFGAPFALPDREKCAIEAAIAMQKRIQATSTPWIRDHFHTGIGISSGKVIVGNIGSPQHMDYTAIGDEVNTASRLQSLAQAGQILVSRNVYNVTQDVFQFREMGSLKVKGKQNSVEVFEVVY